MDHRDHVRLIEAGVAGGGDTWADLGSGSGAFTLALAELLGPGGTIYSVDRDAGSLREQARSLAARFPDVRVRQIATDFTQPIELPPLDGVVMANSLHFVREKAPALEIVRGYLRPGGRLVLVEYDTDRGNHWVPYPLSFKTWQRVASEAGFEDTRKVAAVPSRFLGSIYASVSIR